MYIIWEVYCFDVCGTFLVCVSVILICLVFFNILRFLSKGSVCASYVLRGVHRKNLKIRD